MPKYFLGLMEKWFVVRHRICLWHYKIGTAMDIVLNHPKVNYNKLALLYLIFIYVFSIQSRI